MKEEEWKKVIDINLGSTFFLCKYAIKKMLKNKYGRIVNITSIVGHTGNLGQANYAASKAGIIGMTKNLARKLYPDNIRVNAISAGLFRAKSGEGKVTPASAFLHRTGHPEDIAYTALFLASNESNWITGQVVTVDGGVDVSARNVWEYERS